MGQQRRERNELVEHLDRRRPLWGLPDRRNLAVLVDAHDPTAASAMRRLLRNARSHADRRGRGYLNPSARSLQRCGAADGPVSSGVSQDSRAGKHKRSSMDVVDETAGWCNTAVSTHHLGPRTTAGSERLQARRGGSAARPARVPRPFRGAVCAACSSALASRVSGRRGPAQARFPLGWGRPSCSPHGAGESPTPAGYWSWLESGSSGRAVKSAI